MGCVNSDGSISASGRKMLTALRNPMTPEQIAQAAGQPLFQVRSSLRQMAEAGLVEKIGDKYKSTAEGLKLAET